MVQSPCQGAQCCLGPVTLAEPRHNCSNSCAGQGTEKHPADGSPDAHNRRIVSDQANNEAKYVDRHNEGATAQGTFRRSGVLRLLRHGALVAEKP